MVIVVIMAKQGFIRTSLFEALYPYRFLLSFFVTIHHPSLIFMIMKTMKGVLSGDPVQAVQKRSGRMCWTSRSQPACSIIQSYSLSGQGRCRHG